MPWSLLSVQRKRVGPDDDDYFALGGDGILSARVVARARNNGNALTPTADLILDAITIRPIIPSLAARPAVPHGNRGHP
ncbi:hypothetical protein GL305_10485 [Nocardia seriolae]|uniref:hypothetical protein n=1 Tax=Nocardia seriolae TaxID=37332 RepID=UPI0008FF0EB7|nr:hypothetical protein [Nocardia seriolae]MTJ75851.1 hypothetical protein [Nocardia seriolae]MTJ86427.1 hypothetical protein [Nocardia seriolae]MTK30419.1 hypothetical protein [Nocardia seriolae]MTK46991.1 hypothetical protein [Nocardia seriolae]MTL12015.1 hypothetical protein [Nocardia seriolae]